MILGLKQSPNKRPIAIKTFFFAVFASARLILAKYQTFFKKCRFLLKNYLTFAKFNLTNGDCLTSISHR